MLYQVEIISMPSKVEHDETSHLIVKRFNNQNLGSKSF